MTMTLVVQAVHGVNKNLKKSSYEDDSSRSTFWKLLQFTKIAQMLVRNVLELMNLAKEEGTDDDAFEEYEVDDLFEEVA